MKLSKGQDDFDLVFRRKKFEWYTVWLYNHVYSCWMIALYYGMFISESKKK